MAKIPILVLAFNRPQHVKEAMKAIREYKPDRIYLECDGARQHKNGESEMVERTRKTMLDSIDWPCQVKTLFRDENFGCAEAVNDAISWFFKNEEWGIICEDDIILSQDFFKLCEDLLPRYRNQSKIMEISARNESLRSDISNTYVYSQCYHCWGWATWRRAWNKMDMSMSAVKRHNPFYYIKRLGFFRGVMMTYYFTSAYHSLPHFNSWATRWYLSILDYDGLVICPGVNLALNIGMDCGTHYRERTPNLFSNLLIGKIDWPIVYNDTFLPDKIQTRCDNLVFIKMRENGMKQKFKKIIP